MSQRWFALACACAALADASRVVLPVSPAHTQAGHILFDDAVVFNRTLYLRDLPEHERAFVHDALRDVLPAYDMLYMRRPARDQKVAFTALRIELAQRAPPCTQSFGGTSLLHAAWLYDVNFHAHWDNLWPLVDAIQTLPGCDVDTLNCTQSLTLHKLPTYPIAPRNRPVLVWQLVDALFDQVVDGQSTFGRPDEVLCFDQLMWGRGPRFGGGHQVGFPDDNVQPAPLRELDVRFARVVSGLRRFAYNFAGVPQPEPVARPRRTPNVMLVHRDTSTQRHLIHGEQALADCSAIATCVECCDFHNLDLHGFLSFMREQDVLVGVHGSGMTNVIYARPGALLIDLIDKVDASIWAHKFRAMSEAAGGSFVAQPSTYPAADLGQARQVIRDWAMNRTVQSKTTQE